MIHARTKHTNAEIYNCYHDTSIASVAISDRNGLREQRERSINYNYFFAHYLLRSSNRRRFRRFDESRRYVTCTLARDTTLRPCDAHFLVRAVLSRLRHYNRSKTRDNFSARRGRSASINYPRPRGRLLIIPRVISDA